MQMPVNHWKAGGFSAFNGTAEANAAGRYTGRISLMTVQTPFPRPIPAWNGTNCPGFPKPPVNCEAQAVWNAAFPGPNGTVHGFSAVCWYTGKALFEELGERVPVGLMVGSVGGSPIEAWLPKVVFTSSECGRRDDEPACDTNNNVTHSGFFERFIKPFQPYTIGSLVWDQGERDVHCFASTPSSPGNRTATYACHERALIRSWREGFNSSFGFVWQS